jgi:hypothetical protein
MSAHSLAGSTPETHLRSKFVVHPKPDELAIQLKLSIVTVTGRREKKWGFAADGMRLTEVVIKRLTADAPVIRQRIFNATACRPRSQPPTLLVRTASCSRLGRQTFHPLRKKQHPPLVAIADRLVHWASRLAQCNSVSRRRWSNCNPHSVLHRSLPTNTLLRARSARQLAGQDPLPKRSLRTELQSLPKAYGSFSSPKFDLSFWRYRSGSQESVTQEQQVAFFKVRSSFCSNKLAEVLPIDLKYLDHVGKERRPILRAWLSETD